MTTDASGYVEQVRGLLGGRSYLRASLELFTELVQGAGPVADVGCGPGYVTGFLHDAGVDVFGIDLSPEMIAIARRDYPDLRFEVGTRIDLALPDDSVAGIVAFWSVIHVPDHVMPGVIEQFRRVLRPQGLLLVGFHVGDETRHTRPRATRVVQSTLIVTIGGRARSWVGFVTRGSRLRQGWSSDRTRMCREPSSLRAATRDGPGRHQRSGKVPQQTVMPC